MYDIVIIGGGPSGLALAQCISHLNKRILVVDRESDIGGCHRVRRVDGLFTEHGPRVYSKTYTVFQALLKEMNIDFDDVFTKYNFSITRIGGETVFSVLTARELFLLGLEFVKLMLNEYHGRNTMMKQFLESNDFNIDSKELIDRLCKLTDGGGIDKYTLYEFLQLLNQQFFYSLYQPKTPNDIGLFARWKSFLQSKGVTFSLETTIDEISISGQKIDWIGLVTDNNRRKVVADKYIFAIPPKSLYELVQKYQVPHNWGNLREYAQETAYIDYVSVTFHWNTVLDLPNTYGFPKSAWGVAFVVLSDYMKFNETNSKTVISVAATITDRRSKNNNKTADECNKGELINEIFIQLKEAYPNLPAPTVSVMSPGVIYDYDLRKWISKDTAYIITSNKGYLPFRNERIPNMYNVGTHNGKSLYKFTSLESAVSNSVELSKYIFPELGYDKYIRLSRCTSVSDVIRTSVLVLCVFFIYKVIIKNGKQSKRYFGKIK